MAQNGLAPPGAAALRDRWLRLDPNLRGAIWMIGAACGFTLNSALVKWLGATGMPPMQMAFARVFIAFLACLPFLLRAGPRVLATRAPGTHLIRALAGTTATICAIYAVLHLPLADLTALSFTTPLFTILLAVPLLGETIRWRRWTATAVGFLGVLIMVRPGAGTLEPGALLALAMALGIALATVMVKRLPPGETVVGMLFWYSVTALAIISVPAFLVWQAPSPLEWLLLVAIGLCGVSAQALILRAFRIGEATFVAPFDYSKLLLAAAIGLLVFGEVPDLWTLTGAAVIVASTLYIARREARLGRPAPTRDGAA